MKRIFSILTVLVCSMLLQARTLYLKPSLWDTDGAKFAIYYFEGNQNGWSEYLTSVENGVYSGTVPDEYNTVIFCRMNPNGAKDWSGKWNQTSDMTIESGKDMCVISDWNEGYWAKYGEEPGGEDPVTPSDFTSAVPSECTDVMLQAFYWNSYTDNTYGTSKWTVLQSQASEISSYFQLVWLAPSCKAKDNMGYLPSQYSAQSCKMGTPDDLRKLIVALHGGGTRVIADVVINHAGNKSNWTNFFDQDFGSYGKFSPNYTWITSNDEAKNNGNQVGNNADDGQESNANYPDARDWDHKNADVQAMCRAYLKFLKGEVGYDGFRFDYCGGYHVSHINDYVSNAKPYFSVMEYWNGDASVLKRRIDDANKNTLTFDFASFYTCYQQGIASNNYGKLIRPGLRGQGYAKYAVNFVDNHDTFNRSDIGNSDCGNSKDGKSSLNNRDLILQCNAYLLSMPGVPCVFWPHWYKYKSEIKAMITARRMAGVHSESSIDEQSGGGWYKATVHGKYGNVILYLGSAASEAAPSGYTQAIKESKVAMYYTGNGPQGIETVNGERVSGEKFMKDGQLYIRCGEQVFDVLGREVH